MQTNNSDVIIGNTESDSISALAGDDTIFGGGAVTVPDDAADTIDGGTGQDVIYGNGGNDAIFAGEGNDTIFAGFGNNAVSAGLGDDLILGGATGFDADGADSLAGGEGNDTIFGGGTVFQIADGNDTIDGGEGNDEIYGNGGIDSIIGGTGADVIFGGFGNDIIIGGTSTFAPDDGDDTIHGNEGHDAIYGNGGNDSLVGGAGDDTLYSGVSGDTLNGGTGKDVYVINDNQTLTPSSLQTVIEDFDFSNDVINIANSIGMDRFSDLQIAQNNADTILTLTNNFTVILQNVTAPLVSVRHFTFTDLTTGRVTNGLGETATNIGDTVNGAVEGATASRTFELTTGDDSIGGGAGGDKFIDNTDEYSNNDTLDGGAGTDTLSLNGDYSAGVVFDLDINSIETIMLADGNDYNLTVTDAAGLSTIDGSILTAGNVLTLDATNYSGTLAVTGGAADDSIAGGDGSDTLIGGDGNDTLDGDLGDATLTGGNGDDVFFISPSPSSTITVTDFDATNDNEKIDLSEFTPDVTDISHLAMVQNGTDTQITLPNGQTLILQNVTSGNLGVADFIFTAASTFTAGNDGSFVGSFTGDSLDALAGNDTVSGNDGNDSIDGNAGDDLLSGNSGNDTLNGGANNDTATYASAASAVIANLATNNAVNDGDGGSDILNNIENLTGSDFADSLTGDGNANIIEGGAGNDTMDGGASITDVVSYENATAAVTVNVDTGSATGGAGTDSFSNFEYVIASAFNDSVTGDANNNSITGGDGDDTFNGGLGDDTLAGGNGFDTAIFDGAPGSITIDLVGGTATGAGNDVLTSIENVIGSAFNDVIDGSAGDETLDGGFGDDMLDGLGGNDTLSFKSSPAAAVTASLNTGTATGLGNDTFSNFENLQGTNFADTLTGDATNNIIEGCNGNDTIDGLGGDDTASYANATSAVAVSLTTNTSSGGAGVDSLSNIESLLGSGFDDTLSGDGNANTLTGGEGSDTLDGGAGADRLVGSTVTFTQPAGSQTSLSPNLGTVTTDTNISRITDTSGQGNDLFQNSDARQPTLTTVNGRSAINFDGVDDYLTIANTSDINLNTQNVRSTFINFTTGADITSRQFIYEEGAHVNGYSFYIFNSELYIGAWKNNGRDFSHYFKSAVTANTTYTAGFVFDVPNQTFTTYVDGAITGVGEVLLNQGRHSGGITLGANGNTRHESSADNTRGEYFSGSISEFQLYNSALSSTDVAQINGQLSQTWGNDSFSENDSLTGGAGNDTLIGGIGDDTLDGGADTDTVDYSTSGLGVTVNLVSGTATGDGNDSLNNIENIVGSASNDTFILDINDNVVDGGAGFNTANYANAAGAVTVNLATNSATGDGNDTLTNIAGIVGSANADNISGNASANNLQGGAGNDTIGGQDGVDTLVGGADVDSFVWDANSESGIGAGNRDIVTDFNQSQNDQLDFSGFAGAFTFQAGGNGAVDFATTQQIAYQQVGGDTILYVDSNGDDATDFEVQLSGLVNLVVGDFIL